MIILAAILWLITAGVWAFNTAALFVSDRPALGCLSAVLSGASLAVAILLFTSGAA